MRLAFVAFVILLAGCSGSDGPSTPTAPSAPSTPTPPAVTTVTLSGTVSSSTGAGVGGASVAITDGPNAGRSTTTSTNGAYSLGNLTPGTGFVYVRIAGWEEGGTNVALTANRTLPFTLKVIPYAASGAGNTVFDVPRRSTRVAVFARWNGNSTSNFILRHVDGGGIVNAILRNANPYNGTHQIDGGRLEIVSSENISEWRITEQP
jgi:hypothetical protein